MRFSSASSVSTAGLCLVFRFEVPIAPCGFFLKAVQCIVFFSIMVIVVEKISIDYVCIHNTIYYQIDSQFCNFEFSPDFSIDFEISSDKYDLCKYQITFVM